MTPDFRLIANNNDVTERFRDRLLSLRVTDEAGITSDTIDIQLDDRDHRLEWPEHGAELEASLGYKETQVTALGAFIVDEVSHSGPPSTMNIRGKAANMRSELKEKKSRSWDNVTIETIVNTIASDNDLTPRISLALGSILLLHEDQTNESDVHFLTRLGREFDGMAKVAHGFLLFVSRGESKSVSGQLIQPVSLDVSDLVSYRMTHADRGKYQSVRTYQQDSDAAEMVEVRVGEGAPTYTITHPSPTLEQATDKALAKLASLQRGTATLSLSLIGNPNLRAEGRITLGGVRSPVNGEWVMTRVEHSFGSSGFITTVEAEVPKL